MQISSNDVRCPGQFLCQILCHLQNHPCSSKSTLPNIWRYTPSWSRSNLSALKLFLSVQNACMDLRCRCVRHLGCCHLAALHGSNAVHGRHRIQTPWELIIISSPGSLVIQNKTMEKRTKRTWPRRILILDRFGVSI